MISGKGFLGKPLIGLASGWELYIITKAMTIAVVVTVFGTVCIGLGPVALTWNLDSL